MTRKELRKKFNELKKQNNEYLTEQLEKALKSGALNLNEYDNDDYVLAKIIMYVACKNLSYQWKPLSDNYMKEAKNLSHFI